MLIGFLHPAQALLNLSREPQFNYLEIQNLLDNPSQQSSVLLSDLAKAFERVNPHWIMHVLFLRGAPYWVIFFLVDESFIRFAPLSVHLLLLTTVWIWAVPLVSFSSVSLWTRGIIMSIRYPTYLLTVVIWMIMLPVAEDSDGSLELNNLSNPSHPRVLSFLSMLVTLLRF